MKIYTRAGDDGTTGLFGGSRVRKDDARIECYGTLDELNAALGLAAAACAGVPAAGGLAATLEGVQNELFNIGAHLATPDAGASARAALPALDAAMVDRLEAQIDGAEAELPPLRQFILPGGGEAAARLHFARTVCRRAERLLVAFAGGGDPSARPPTVILTYLNRLSDWLFVQARWVNHKAGVPDVPWRKS